MTSLFHLYPRVKNLPFSITSCTIYFPHNLNKTSERGVGSPKRRRVSERGHALQRGERCDLGSAALGEYFICFADRVDSRRSDTASIPTTTINALRGDATEKRVAIPRLYARICGDISPRFHIDQFFSQKRDGRL